MNQDLTRTAGGSGRALRFGVGALLVVVILALGGVAVSAAVVHQNAATAAEDALAELEAAELRLSSAERYLNYHHASAGELTTEVSEILTAAEEVISEDALEAVIVAHAALAESQREVVPFTAPIVGRTMPDAATSELLDEQAAELTAAASVVDDATAAVQDESDQTLELIAALHEALASLPVADLATTAQSEFASATDSTKTGLEAVVAGFSVEDSEPAELVRAFIDALVELKESHVAVETQKAIDAANATGSSTYTDPATGQTMPNPSYGGTGGGSGGSSGGGSTGGTCSGHAFPGGCIPWAPFTYTSNGANCVDGQGASATYGSPVKIPAAALAYYPYEIPGYGWGATWSCPTW